MRIAACLSARWWMVQSGEPHGGCIALCQLDLMPGRWSGKLAFDLVIEHELEFAALLVKAFTQLPPNLRRRHSLIPAKKHADSSGNQTADYSASSIRCADGAGVGLLMEPETSGRIAWGSTLSLGRSGPDSAGVLGYVMLLADPLICRGLCLDGIGLQPLKQPSAVGMAVEPGRQHQACPTEHRQDIGVEYGAATANDVVLSREVFVEQIELAQQLSRPPVRRCFVRSCISAVRTEGKMPNADLKK
jgi:hypothetical protein